MSTAWHGQRGQRWRDVKPCPSEAAYRRHIRYGEVPDEGCRLAANAASDGYRKNREMTVPGDRMEP